nr:putative gamma-glutamyltransferase YwrD [Candidatus Pantoea persica]
MATVYLRTADASGMMVSFVQSNYIGFGSGLVVLETGISLQNYGAFFSLDAAHPNVVAGGKRPFHTIIPAFALDTQGAPLMAFGVMGGPMQAQGHLQLALRVMLHKQDPQAAIDAPCWRVEQGADTWCSERRWSAIRWRRCGSWAIKLRWKIRCRVITSAARRRLCAIPQGFYIAATESRKDGQAVVF